MMKRYKKLFLGKDSNSESPAGFTIIELLVAIGVFSVVISIAVGGLVSALRSQRQVAALIAADNNVSLTLEQMAREVRTGYDFCRPGLACAPPSGCPPLCPFVATNELDFYNSQSQLITYRLTANGIERGVGGAFSQITGGKVIIQYLQFTLFGNLQNDLWPPRIVISIGVTANTTGLLGSVINLQTTISARQLDT